MFKKTCFPVILILAIAALALVGCSLTEPVDSESVGSVAGGTTPDKAPSVFVNLTYQRTGDVITVSWSTMIPTTGAVIWGYDPGSLTNTVTEGESYNHSLSFTAASNEGCVYFKAVGTVGGFTNYSKLMSSVKDIVISNESRTMDPMACTMTLSWTTNVKSSTKAYWGGTCASPANVSYGAGNTTTHSVSFDLTGIPVNSRVYMTPESETDCDSAEGTCAFLVRYFCIQ